MSAGSLPLDGEHVLGERDQVELAEYQADHDCAICLGEMDSVEEQVYEWPGCLHPYHADCAQQWLTAAQERTCPQCRRVAVE